MPEKNVVVLIKSRPFSTLNYYEALLVAAGLWEHRTSILWMGDGVYAALKTADGRLTEKFFIDFPDLDTELYAEEDALRERDLNASDILPGIKVVNRGEITELLREAEASLVF